MVSIIVIIVIVIMAVTVAAVIHIHRPSFASYTVSVPAPSLSVQHLLKLRAYAVGSKSPIASLLPQRTTIDVIGQPNPIILLFEVAS